MDDAVSTSRPVGCVTLTSSVSACHACRRAPIDLSAQSWPYVSAWVTITYPRRRPARSMHRCSQGDPNKTEQMMTARTSKHHQPDNHPDRTYILGRRRRQIATRSHIDVRRHEQRKRAIYLHHHAASSQPPFSFALPSASSQIRSILFYTLPSS
jgi:hypothetical protein